MDYKENILSHIIDYLKTTKWQYKVVKDTVTLVCPFCNNPAQTARQIPHTHKISCINPQCTHKKKFSLLSFIRLTESDKFNWSEDQILHHIKIKLGLEIKSPIDRENIEELFKKYKELGFSLLPVKRLDKEPIESEWQLKEHKDISEWMEYLKRDINIGLRTGVSSGITVLDIDCLTKAEEYELLEIYNNKTKQKRIEELKSKIKIPENIKKIMGETLIQKTWKGYHLIYKYDSGLRKAPITVDGTNIDVENDGGAIVICPSIIHRYYKTKEPGAKHYNKEKIFALKTQRKFINDNPIIEMPRELRYLILENLAPIKENKEDKIKLDIQSEIFKIDPKDFNLKNNGLEGICNDSFIRLGGVLRKELSAEKTEYVLKLLNNTLLEDPMEHKHITAIVNQLDKYDWHNEEKLANEILNYIKDSEEALKDDIERAIVGNRPKGEDKLKLDKCLSYLIRENYIKKRGRNYSPVKRLNLKTSLIGKFKDVDYNVPFFDDLMYFAQGDIILIGASPGTGKCFGKGTGILMFDGSIKKVEEIIVGDQVMGVDSTPRNVLRTGTGFETMYEVASNKGDSFKVNKSHILSLKSSGFDNKPKGNIINISVNDYLKKPKYYQDRHKLYRVPVDFPEKKIDLEPYFLGVWLGDGDQTNTRITNQDSEIIDYLDKYAKRLNLKLIKYSYKDRCASYAITSGIPGGNKRFSLQTLMKKLDIIGKDKRIPREYLINSRKNRLELLAGLIDSDGYKDGGSGYCIVSARKKLAEDIVYLCRSLGFRSGINLKHVKLKSWDVAREYYKVSIVGDCMVIPIKVYRKTPQKRKINKDPLVTGFTLKELKKEKYYGFSLDGDHLHLIDSFIVNHNTHVAMNIVKRLVVQKIKPIYVSLETGSRFMDIALTLGLKETDFEYDDETLDATGFEFEDNAITIIDWLCPKDFKYMDKIISHFNGQLNKHGGFLFLFVQLRDNGDWFAKDLIEQFPAMTVKFFLDDEDRLKGHFEIRKRRAARRKTNRQRIIPTLFNDITGELLRVDELKTTKTIINSPIEEVNLGAGDEK